MSKEVVCLAVREGVVAGLIAGLGMKEVSTRRIRPCLPELDVDRVVSLIRGWESEWEQGGVSVHDDGLMQYTLVDSESHHRFYAALVLGKSSLRCSLESQEPADLLAEVTRGEFIVHPEAGLSEEAQTVLQHLKSVLGKRGFRFPA